MWHFYFLYFLYGSHIPSVQADATTTPVVSASEALFHTEGGAPDAVSTTTASAASSNQHECSGDLNLLTMCPPCDGRIIQIDQFTEYWVFCDTAFANVTYNEIFFFQQPTVNQCISACTSSPHCYAPVFGPGGRCLQALIASGDSPALAIQSGYTVLLPWFTGFLPPPLPSEVLTQSDSSTASSTKRATATKHCDASDISCPRCNRAQVEDPSGTTYKVLCNNEIYSDKRHIIHQQLSAQECMAACSNSSRCGGSTFWPEGHCWLAKGEDVFPQRHIGRTALLSIDPTFTPPPLSLSAYPTVQPSAVFSFVPPNLEHCKRSRPTCPRCDRLRLRAGRREYSIRCDVQPNCRTVLKRQKEESPRACLECCARERTCQAAIYESGRCVLCDGSIRSLKPYLLPDEYVVFIAEGA